MSDYYDGSYSNGADGICQACGAETAEDWHRMCRRCYASEQGWTRPARPEPGTPPVSFVEGLVRLREEVAELRARLERLERRRAA